MRNSRQRLVVCLDGTWNRQDSSTNVLHHFNLVREGPVPGTDFIQRRYYHRGVGTNSLDSITGGGFGIGLEANVRDAYNWLVRNYHAGDDERDGDEIYIFGFSRGAYEARSLVGFIGQCGLLRRGAPITVTQLWDSYCILGRQKEQRRSAWERIFDPEPPRVRAFTDLEHSDDLTGPERLLLDWSRRVPIEYLGIYDTVGALGWDALAIPGLTSRLALHNNVRPTTLIQHCRHALAIDEQRSNFKHTAFVSFLEEDSAELQRVEGPQARDIEQNRAMWRRKIEQRWFVGAHSNVGGGYDNNVLAQRPLQWLMEGAAACGLQQEALAQPAPVSASDVLPVDSYAEFAAPLWESIIRNKRNFRGIDPPPELRAGRHPGGRGFALESIHETVDASVVSYWQNSGQPIPPNLESYLLRESTQLPEGFTPARHSWMRERWLAYPVLAVWSAVAVLGAYALDGVGDFTRNGLPVWFAIAAALFLPVVDWGESKVTFVQAAGEGRPWGRAFLDSVYWTRTLGFVLFVIGAVYGVSFLIGAGLRQEFPVSGELLPTLLAIPALAALPGVCITRLRSGSAWLAILLAPAGLALTGAVLFSGGWMVSALFGVSGAAPFPDNTGSLSIPGLLLLLQAGGVYFWRSLLWTAEPLEKARLGSITRLQLCATPAQVTKCLDAWRDSLSNTVEPDRTPDGPPAATLRRILRYALWRDMIGFIPVYSLYLLLGLKFATLVPSQHWTALIAWVPVDGFAATLRSLAAPLVSFWWVLPVVAAATDYIEDACHLSYCKRYELPAGESAPPAALTMVSFLMTLVKDVTFVAAGLVTAGAVFAGTHACWAQVDDWRARLAIVLTGFGVVSIALVAVAALVARVRKAAR